MSADRGFFASRPFSRADQLLREQGGQPLDWKLPSRHGPWPTEPLLCTVRATLRIRAEVGGLGMKVNRPKPGLRQPILSYDPDELPRTEPEALSPVPVEQPPLLSRKWWKKNWKKVAVAGLVPFSAASGFTNPLVQAATSTPPRTSTVTPVRTVQTQQVFSYSIFTSDLLDGGHYTFNGPWQAKAGTDGHAAALELASSVVDVANKCAGRHWLPPEVRRYLIQLVLLGIGGIDPDNAGDILELAAEKCRRSAASPPETGTAHHRADPARRARPA